MLSWSSAPSPFGPGALLGLFELWLRGAGAKLMGPEAEQRWLQAVRAGASPPPPTLHFSLDGENFELEERTFRGAAKLAHGRCPVTTAWSTFVWETAFEAVGARYGDASTLVLTLQADSDSATGQSQLTMRSLCQKLHVVPSAGTERQA